MLLLTHTELLAVITFMDLDFNGGVYKLTPVAGRSIMVEAQDSTNLIIF